MDGLYFLVGLLFLAGAAWFALYLLQCFALWRMAKRAGLPWAGLAWVPYAQNWLLGWLCDRGCDFRTGRNWRFRYILLAVSLATPSFLNTYLMERLSLPTLYDLMNRWGLYQFPSLLQTAGAVVTAWGLYHLYADYVPGKETAYAILSAVVPIAAPGILLFRLRNRVPLSEGGTPPPAPPAWTTGTTGPARHPAPPPPAEGPPPWTAGPSRCQAPMSPPPGEQDDPPPAMPPFRWTDGPKDQNKK